MFSSVLALRVFQLPKQLKQISLCITLFFSGEGLSCGACRHLSLAVQLTSSFSGVSPGSSLAEQVADCRSAQSCSNLRLIEM